MKRTLTILGLLFFILTSRPVLGCDCKEKSTVNGSYKNSDIVISGQVISTTEENLTDKRILVRKVLVKVETIFKGQTTKDTLTMYTGIGTRDCGYEFVTGQKYIIYGYKHHNFASEQNVYETNICTRTQEYNRTEIKELEKIEK